MSSCWKEPWSRSCSSPSSSFSPYFSWFERPQVPPSSPAGTCRTGTALECLHTPLSSCSPRFQNNDKFEIIYKLQNCDRYYSTLFPGVGGGGDQWETGIGSFDLRANERPGKNNFKLKTYIHTFIQTLWLTDQLGPGGQVGENSGCNTKTEKKTKEPNIELKRTKKNL